MSEGNVPVYRPGMAQEKSGHPKSKRKTENGDMKISRALWLKKNDTKLHVRDN